MSAVSLVIEIDKRTLSSAMICVRKDPAVDSLSATSDANLVTRSLKLFVCNTAAIAELRNKSAEFDSDSSDVVV